MRRPRHLQAVDERGLARALAGNDEAGDPGVAGAFGDAQHAMAVAQLSAKRELAEHRPARELGRGQLLGGHEHPARRREIETRADLAQMRGREVDRDAPLRELEAGVDECGLHALARLSYGRVAAADDRERGQAAAQVDLHGDPA